MPKLHQHIAIEKEIQGAAEKIKNETVKLFKAGSHFKGFVKVYTPKDDSGDPLPREEQEVVATVPKRIDWTTRKLIAVIDHEATKDLTNMEAKADLVVDGETIATGVPATTLLGLEKKLRDIRSVYDLIPTLDMSNKWQPSDGEKDIYVYVPPEQYRTAKKTEAVVMAEATDKFPAQIKDVVVDRVVGTFASKHFSGAVPPGKKAQWIENIDRLIEAVKQARQEANEAEVREAKIGKKVFDFIHGK